MQLSLFPNVLKLVFLESDSARKAWWELKLVESFGEYTIVKKSGIKTGLLDKRVWAVENYEKGLKLFEKKVKSKLNKKRKIRRYRVVR